MYIKQKQLEFLSENINKNNVLVVYGARCSGKTTLLNKYLETEDRKYLFVSGEDIIIREHLTSQLIEKVKNFISDVKLLVIDEAQKINEIGKEISFSELGTQLGMSKNTVERYLDLLEKSFVIFRLGGSAGICEKRSVRIAGFIFAMSG